MLPQSVDFEIIIVFELLQANTSLPFYRVAKSIEIKMCSCFSYFKPAFSITFLEAWFSGKASAIILFKLAVSKPYKTDAFAARVAIPFPQYVLAKS